MSGDRTVCIVGAVGVSGDDRDRAVPAVGSDRPVQHGRPRRARHPRPRQRRHHGLLRQTTGSYQVQSLSTRVLTTFPEVQIFHKNPSLNALTAFTIFFPIFSQHIRHMSHFSYACKTERQNGISCLISELLHTLNSSLRDRLFHVTEWTFPNSLFIQTC